MKIGCIIVTFNPDIKQLVRNLASVSKQVSMVYIVDNGSYNYHNITGLKKIYDNLKIIELKKNTGIANAQNVGFNEFNKLEFDWVLTLDQDSVISEGYVSKLKLFTDQEKTGLVTGAYFDTKWNSEQIRSVRKKRSQKVEKINEEISSGNLISISAWKQVGGFDDQLFIDYVDFDFDYKLSEAGYYLYRVNDAEFEHEIGEPVSRGALTTVLFLNKKDLFDHSAQRLFYMNRNRIIVRKRHRQFGSPLRMTIRELLNLREILVMGPPRSKKMKNAIAGILQGVFK